MDRPNKITNRNTGTHVVTGIFSGKPSACPSKPHWGTAVSTPYDAHTDSRFIAAAWTAMTTDRNATSSGRRSARRRAAFWTRTAEHLAPEEGVQPRRAGQLRTCEAE